MNYTFNYSKPSVAILLATYNGEKYLAELLDSLLSQTYKNINIYISDDSSTDTTKQIIQSYEKNYPEVKEISRNERNKSACKNFMSMLHYYTYKEDLFMFCDQDDVWNPDKVEKTVNYYLRNAKSYQLPILVHTDLEVVDENLNRISSSFYNYSNIKNSFDSINQLLIQNNVTGCTVLINRPLFELGLILPTSELNYISMHDHFFAILASAFGSIYFLNEATIKYRQHSENSVGAQNTKSLSYIIKKIINRKEKLNYIKLQQQAKVISQFYQERFNNKQKKLLGNFSNLEQQNKLSRVFFIIKNKILKDSFIRRVLEIIYI